ncbi:hypothetical protein FRB97_002431 [Tulasnella sp. 331]|nr:hypothetical protein FRB97_002431 [Tulasnella sp. 331]
MSDQILPLERLTFEGTAGENVTQFLQAVNRVAFAQGRQRDQQWLSDYLVTCLAGDALVWYLKLDESTRCDFYMLSIAMIEQFRIANPEYIPYAPPAAAPTSPPGSSSVKTLKSSITLPPAPGTQRSLTLPPTNITLAPSTTLPPTSRLDSIVPAHVPQAPIIISQGRIKIVRPGGLSLGYCGPERFDVDLWRWDCTATPLVDEALIVKLLGPSDPANAPLQLLEVTFGAGTSRKGFFGVYRPGKDSASGTELWRPCFSDLGSSKPYPRAKSVNHPGEEVASLVWICVQNTGELTVTQILP